MLIDTPICEFGWKASDFTLSDPDGNRFTMSEQLGEKGLLIMFICNHCPYVQAVADHLTGDVKEIQSEGINVLAVMSNDYRYVQIDIMGGENLHSDYLAVNPRGVLPTLQLDDGSIIDDSSAICRFFEETHPEPPLFGTDAKSKAQVESWVRQIESDAFTPTADVLRNSNPIFENRSVPGTDNTPQITELAERGANRVQAFYNRLNAHLAHSKHVVGDSYTAADVTALCAIDFAEFAGIKVPSNFNYLAEWRNRVSSRPSALA